MLMDSVTVLLHRLGVAYMAIMNPVFRVRREPDRRAAGHRCPPPDADASRRRHRRDLDPRPAVRSRSIPRRVAEAERLLPSVLADARQVALDSRAMNGDAAQSGRRARRRPRGTVPQPRPQGRRGAVALAGRRAFRAAGLPALPGARRAGLGRPVQPPRRAPAARRRAAAAHRQRRPAGAGAGHDSQLPALRRLPVHRGRPRTAPAHQADRAPVRRPVHRRRDERQRAGDPADLAAGQRRARDGAARPEPSRPAAARHHPDHSALGAVRA